MSDAIPVTIIPVLTISAIIAYIAGKAKDMVVSGLLEILNSQGSIGESTFAFISAILIVSGLMALYNKISNC